MLHDDDGAGFGLYIHWPFCRSKCPYCDFNSHVEGKVDHARWRRALLRELDHVADLVGRRPLTSIFFGGGTPSLMDPATVAALIDQATARFQPLETIEITLEANPTSAERERLADFAQAGVNRASIGVQALDDRALRFLGREHGAVEAIAAVDLFRYPGGASCAGPKGLVRRRPWTEAGSAAKRRGPEPLVPRGIS